MTLQRDSALRAVAWAIVTDYPLPEDESQLESFMTLVAGVFAEYPDHFERIPERWPEEFARATTILAQLDQG